MTLSILFLVLSCKQNIKKEITNYDYYNVPVFDTLSKPLLIAITDEDYLQYGVNVAFINHNGDTIIPFGKYTYYGTDTLKYYANVIEHPNDSVWGRRIAIDRSQNILFDLVSFDNGPDYFSEGLTRSQRNGKMGFSNKYGQIVIPCIYDFVKSFENGKAEVTINTTEYIDIDGPPHIESKEWFYINKQGEKIKYE